MFNTKWNAELGTQWCRKVKTNSTACEYKINANASLELAAALDD